LCRNSLLKHGTEGKIEGTERQVRISKQLMDDLKENKRYCNLKRAERLKLFRTSHHTKFYKNEIFPTFCSDCDVTKDTQLKSIQLVF